MGAPTTTVAPEAPITKKRSPRRRFVIPDGWVARGFTFEVTWPADPGAAAKIHSHFGARRFAYNRALAQVKADLDAKKADPAHVSVPWNLYAIRKQFNAENHAIAPWWEENSKEAYATGIADLCVALKNWSDSRSGKRVGRRSASRGSGPRGRTGPGCALRPGPSGSNPTGGPSPCRWWGHSDQRRAPGTPGAGGQGPNPLRHPVRAVGAAVRLVFLRRGSPPASGSDRGRPGRR